MGEGGHRSTNVIIRCCSCFLPEAAPLTWFIRRAHVSTRASAWLYRPIPSSVSLGHICWDGVLWWRTAQTGCQDRVHAIIKVEQPVLQKRQSWQAHKHILLGIPRNRGRPHTSQRASSAGPLSVFSGNNKAFLPHREPLVPTGTGSLQGTVEHLNSRNCHRVILRMNPNMPGHAWSL